MLQSRNYMNDDIIIRVKQAANIMIENPEITIRSVAKQLGVSKSTIHKDLIDRLPQIDPVSYTAVRTILEDHWQTKHIKGGEATKQRYAQNL